MRATGHAISTGLGDGVGQYRAEAEKKIKHHDIVHRVMHNFCMKAYPRQKLGHAVACTSVAHMQLHDPNGGTFCLGPFRCCGVVGGNHHWICDEYESAKQGQYCDVIWMELVFLWGFHNFFVWKGYIGYCRRIILKHYEGTLRLKALC